MKTLIRQNPNVYSLVHVKINVQATFIVLQQLFYDSRLSCEKSNKSTFSFFLGLYISMIS